MAADQLNSNIKGDEMQSSKRVSNLEQLLRLIALEVAFWVFTRVLEFANLWCLKFVYSIAVHYFHWSIGEYAIHRFVLHNRKGHRQHHMSTQWDMALTFDEHDGVFFNVLGSILPIWLVSVPYTHCIFQVLLQYDVPRWFSCLIGTFGSCFYYMAWNFFHPLFHQVPVGNATELKHWWDPATIPSPKSSKALSPCSRKEFKLTVEGAALEEWLYAHPFVHRLYQHHALHHLLPISVNFNIVFQGCDWVVGDHRGCLRDEDLKFDDDGNPFDHPRVRTLMAMKEKGIKLPYGMEFCKGPCCSCKLSGPAKLRMLFVGILTTAGLNFMDSARTLQECGWKMWYNFLSSRWAPSTGRNWAFLNYAYEPADPKDKLAASNPDELKDLPSMQLYHHTAAPDKVQWAGKTVLEIGSGRGGGAAFLSQKLKPKSYVALDYAANQIDTCRRIHADVKGLSFVCGNAMELPFEDQSFDIIMNVESSHVYSDFSKFVKEVHRVLKPGGSFCWTDFRAIHKWEDVEAKLKAAGFADDLEDITNEVVRGLDVSSAEREKLINHLFQWQLPGLSSLGECLRGLVHNFAGSPGSEVYKKFSSRAWVYKAAVFRKQS